MLALVYSKKLGNMAEAAPDDRLLVAFDQFRDVLCILDDECSAVLTAPERNIYGCVEPDKLLDVVGNWNEVIRTEIERDAKILFASDVDIGEQFKGKTQTQDAYELKKLSFLMNNDLYVYGKFGVFGPSDDNLSVFIEDVEEIKKDLACYALINVHVL